jgi:hypothetical protein
MRPSFFKRSACLTLTLLETPAHTVDPSETERLVKCLWIGDALLAGVFLVKANLQLVSTIVVLLQPLTKLLGRTEKLRFH